MWYEDKVNQGQVELGDQLEGVPHIVAHVEWIFIILIEKHQ